MYRINVTHQHDGIYQLEVLKKVNTRHEPTVFGAIMTNYTSLMKRIVYTEALQNGQPYPCAFNYARSDGKCISKSFAKEVLLKNKVGLTSNCSYLGH